MGRRSRGKRKEGERRKKRERTTTRFLEVSFRADPLFQPGVSLDQGEGNDGKHSPVSESKDAWRVEMHWGPACHQRGSNQVHTQH